MNTELYIENYRLDITTEISALLNFAIDDIKDFSARSTTWSRTIVLPGTSNNNKLFGHIFQVGQSNVYNNSIPNVGYNFNASKSARVVLFQDQIQTFKGVLRLLQININNGFQGACEYEVSVFGNLSGLNSALTGKLLENLDFSAYDHIFSDTNIVASWDNPGGSGVYYPLIDYGTYSAEKHDWDIRTFRPALYVREYIDKMITAAGFRWSSDLFETARFKGLVVPHNQKRLTKLGTTLVSATYEAVPPSEFAFTDSSSSPQLLTWDSFGGTDFSINGLNQTITYTGSDTITATISLTITGGYDSTINPLGIQTLLFGEVITDMFPLGSGPINITKTITKAIAPGAIFNTGAIWSFTPTGETFLLTISAASLKINSTGITAVNINPGDDVVVNETIPKNIRQIDFLVSIVKLFNLYVYEDRNDETLIYIKPYIDFYSPNTSNAVDWTHKLNRNKVVKVKPMSELNAKIYKFKFKSDSDYYNDQYRKRYNEGYGDRVYDSEFEFSSQEKSFEIVFSSTPLVGYVGEDKVYSTIFKGTGSGLAPTEELTDSNIRILQTKKITGVTAWSIKNATTVLSTVTRYGYAGHLDDPDVPNNDINFGSTRELFFQLTNTGNLNNTQFNVFWATYMREVTDKDSKLVIGSFYLTAKDILNLDFSKFIYLDGIAYRLNAIKDYDATTPNDCLVELFKVNASSNLEVTNPDGPPDGCYLLWSDEQTLDWSDADELLYSSCLDNPGDGGGEPSGYSLNWAFSKITSLGTFRIYVNGVLTGTTTTNGDTGVFPIEAGDTIKVDVVGASFFSNKRILVTNDIDGVVYDDTSILISTKTYTFVVVANRNYSVVGQANH